MAVQVASLVARLGLDKDKFDKGLKNAGGKLDKFGSKLKTGLAVGAGAAGAALVGVGAAALDMEKDIDNATAALAADLGITKEAASEFEDEMEDIFTSNFADGFEDIADKIGVVKKQLKDIDDKELVDVTKGAISISDAFDKDFAETIDASKVLMEEFDLTSRQALDFIAKGMQEGLDRSGDFLDSIREYGNLFGDAGFAAEQMFSILETGAEGGVLGTDKVADAIKEFQVIMNEGSADTAAAFEQITGKSFEKVQGFIASGDESWGDYFDKVIAGLNKIEDPLERNRLQVELFGTMAEDLGTSFTEGLSDAQTSLEDMAGATDALNEQYDTIGNQLQTVGRQAMVALRPVSEQLFAGAANLLENAIPIFTEFSENLTEVLGPAALVINDAFTRMGKAFGITNEEVTGMDVIMGILKGTLDAIVIGVQAVAVVLSLVASAIETVSALVASAKEAWNGFGDTLSDIGDSLPDWLVPGSPTPLEMGLKSLAQQVRAMPNLADAFGMNGTAMTPVGGAPSGNVTINMGGQSMTFDNSDQGVNEALLTMVRILRAQIEQG